MTWQERASAILAAAAGAELSAEVKRKVFAPGPLFAHDCRLIAVHLGPIEALPPSGGQFPGGNCVLVPALTVIVTFAADGVPMPQPNSGNPPDQLAVTKWSETFTRDAELVWNAVADAIYEGAAGPCDSVEILPSTSSGPLGGMAAIQIPVRLLAY